MSHPPPLPRQLRLPGHFAWWGDGFLCAKKTAPRTAAPSFRYLFFYDRERDPDLEPRAPAGRGGEREAQILRDLARELIVFDSPASGSMSLAQFKLQYGALLSGETMSRFCPPFSICAFRSRDPQQTEGDYTQALAEMKEHFPDSFSIVSRGTLYAFFYACDRSCFSELENFSYQFQLRAGLSDRFDTLEERHYFKKQARELLKIGEHTASSKYVFPFFENYTQLLLCNAADRFGAQAFVLSDVERLRELDAESGNNNMLQTLWQYSRCFNTPTAAAKALYVDRSTLHYRLKKISELMETDLDVPASAQALSASIWLREIYRFSDGADKQN